MQIIISKVQWLNFYHAQCEQKLGAELRAQGKESIAVWLKEACSPIEVKSVGPH